jgi:anti-sigma B factor antagonist
MADLVIETRRVGDTPVLDVTGEVDSYNAPRLRERMVALIDEGTPNLVINMTGVEYIDSTGLGTLVAALKRATERGGALSLICPNEQIYKVFHITGLVKVFPIHKDEAEAFAAGTPAAPAGAAA